MMIDESRKTKCLEIKKQMHYLIFSKSEFNKCLLIEYIIYIYKLYLKKYNYIYNIE